MKREDIKAMFAPVVSEPVLGVGALVERMREDLKKANDREVIEEHERMLHRALVDMVLFHEAALDMHARGDEKRCLEDRGNACWARANALKHEKALRTEFPGYQMPRDLRALWVASMGSALGMQ